MQSSGDLALKIRLLVADWHVHVYILDSSFFSYCDRTPYVQIDRLINMHKTSGRSATFTVVQHSGRYGLLYIDEADSVTNF